MANVFKQQNDVTQHPNRNNFDLFHQNHMTMKMGYYYPTLCMLGVPGDSFRINTGLGIKFMPLNFTVQSRMRAYVHYFKVPLRILWDNWKDFAAGIDTMNNEQFVHPYIHREEKSDGFFKTGSLADYLGVPTTVVNTDNRLVSVPVWSNEPTSYSVDVNGDGVPDAGYSYARKPYLVALYQHLSGSERNMYTTVRYDSSFSGILPDPTGGMLNVHPLVGFIVELRFAPTDWKLYIPAELAAVFSPTSCNPYVYMQLTDLQSPQLNNMWCVPDAGSGIKLTPQSDQDPQGNTYFFLDLSAIGETLERMIKQNRGVRIFIGSDQNALAGTSNLSYYMGHIPNNLQAYTDWSDGVDYEDINLRTYTDDIRLNALPFRAYEAIYNAFYRSTHGVQDFIVNGKKVFNKFVTNSGDGPDTTDYHLFERNWELDFLTSCMPSPQAGIAPLVGMTALGNISVTDEDGVVTNATYNTLHDGKTLSGTVSIHNPGESIENDRTLSRAAMLAAGMSINDFRNVNQFQKFLEQTLRSGYRYYDYIRGHFGDGPKKAELDMPEFCGGFTQDVSVTMVTQTSAGTDDSPLGSYAGQANAFGGSNHSVDIYCDDYCYIMGIISVVPDPAYSQVLPKHFLNKDRLDYYYPEFANIGMQPVKIKEVAPLQASLEKVNLESTFGYQRPYYDMVQMVDEVHGQFRLTLRDMLINRVFSQTPQLSDDFLKIHPEETSNIFSVDAPDEDNLIGQVIMDISAKRPLPRVSIPNIN